MRTKGIKAFSKRIRCCSADGRKRYENDLWTQIFLKTEKKTVPFSFENGFSVSSKTILVPRGRAPFGQHQESRPLARPNDIPFLNGLVNTID